jgi:hypothetical protein
MPGFITHSLFARDVLKNLKQPDLKSEIEKRMPLYYLGAQGPDIFFYYKAKPWLKYDGIEKLGFTMHYTKTSDFFIGSLDYIMKQKNLSKLKSEYMNITVYIMGYLCHFALDSTAHPLIHYTAGINTRKNNSTFRYHIYHKQLESIIDAYMLKLKDKKNAHFYRDFELIDGVSKYQKILEDFYIFITKEIYDVSISSLQLNNVTGDISRILKILYDPLNIKIWFFKIFEKLYGRPGEITSSMYPRKINLKIDYLNFNHDTWTHPCKKDYKSDLSFLDLYEKAEEQAEEMIDISLKYLSGNTTTSEVKKIIKNISYSTGIKCGLEDKLRYFNSIFENPRFLKA